MNRIIRAVKAFWAEWNAPVTGMIDHTFITDPAAGWLVIHELAN